MEDTEEFGNIENNRRRDPFTEAFKVLGIEKTRDRSEIKSAYIARAKKTHPEDDEEGFQKLHDAYKTALFYCNSDDQGRIRLVAKGMADAPAPVKEADSSTSSTAVTPEKEAGPSLADSFDFSSVDLSNAPPKTVEDLIISDIVEFKEVNKLSRFKRLDNGSRIRLTSTLLMLYKALALATDDETVWDSFVEEPIVQFYIGDSNFRKFMLDAMPRDSKHYDKIMSINEQHELSDTDPIEPVNMSQQRFTSKPRPRQNVPQPGPQTTKERASGVKLFIPIALGLFMSFLVALCCKLNGIFDAPLLKIWLIIAGAVASVVIILVLLASIKKDMR